MAKTNRKLLAKAIYSQITLLVSFADRFFETKKQDFYAFRLPRELYFNFIVSIHTTYSFKNYKLT